MGFYLFLGFYWATRLLSALKEASYYRCNAWTIMEDIEARIISAMFYILVLYSFWLPFTHSFSFFLGLPFYSQHSVSSSTSWRILVITLLLLLKSLMYLVMSIPLTLLGLSLTFTSLVVHLPMIWRASLAGSWLNLFTMKGLGEFSLKFSMYCL